ncbi:MAG: MBL fold metallo-hydrolase [Deltaproteobacteria bacterium]|nr:MBL fold metallo-hydrolase [Deltaproteobacteria bacterium]MBZ0220084.1 GPMC system MBL fold metallohydrolase [Deltaproteobacteria bacterium]
MKIVILGCGTSTGVPVIGCHCEICSSPNPLDKRTRSSLLIHSNGRNVLIDTSTDLRAQALANGIERIDAVLYTHPHADHIHGIDDLRAFNLSNGNAAIPCYGSARTVSRIMSTFEYIFRDDGMDGWKPNLSIQAVEGPFELFGENVTPVPVMHGQAAIFGWRVGKLAYVTDCSEIPESSFKALRGAELLILGALRQKPHPTHFTISQALEAAKKIGAQRTIFTHLSHNVLYERDSKTLPPGVEFAHDGLTAEI